MVLEDFFRRRSTLRRFRLAPLGAELDGYCHWLCAQGYSRRSVRLRVSPLSHFNQYLRQQGISDCCDVERRHAEQFAGKEDLYVRRADRRASRHIKIASSVRSFMEYLTGQGFLAASSDSPCLYEKTLDEYVAYLKDERGLAATTVKTRSRYLIPLLQDLGSNAATTRLCRLSPQEVQALFVTHARDARHTIRQVIQGAWRTFFRFCRKRGYTQCDLAEVIPSIRTYKLSRVPRCISEQDAQKVLDSIDRTTPVGRRDYAIIQLLHTYGVRGGQIRKLRLQDIDWRRSRIRFAGLKGGKEVVQPLLDAVAEGLLNYLRDGRPQAPFPEVFLTAVPPWRPLRIPSTVSALVGSHMRQAGVDGLPMGSHVFRHGFATRMLKHGEPLKTIADMLGHRDINSTFIYTKIDLETLKEVALDWPEV